VFETLQMWIANMSNARKAELHIYSLIGVTLLHVQLAERALGETVKLVLKDRTLTPSKLMELTEPERKKTLGDFLKELKTRTRLETAFKDKLYRFLKMRNTFIHNISELPGWDVKTDAGREKGIEFLAELLHLALTVTGVFTSLFAISARDELGEELFEGNRLVRLMEEHFGSTARKILAARIR
jgi:hypothetical protein